MPGTVCLMTPARFESEPTSSPQTSSIALSVSTWGRLSFEVYGIHSVMWELEHEHRDAERAQ